MQTIDIRTLAKSMILQQSIPRLEMEEYYANSSTLTKYYIVSLRHQNSNFRLTKFEMSYDDYKELGENITFEDGIYRQGDFYYVYWVLPWKGYQISVKDSAAPTDSNIVSIIENSMILMAINGIAAYNHLTHQPSGNTDAATYFGYNRQVLTSYIQLLLPCCCFFYGHHRLVSKDKIKLKDFILKCVVYFLSMIERGEDLWSVMTIRNTINFRSRYSKGDTDHVVKVTIGNGSRGQKHATFMTKYGGRHKGKNKRVA